MGTLKKPTASSASAWIRTTSQRTRTVLVVVGQRTTKETGTAMTRITIVVAHMMAVTAAKKPWGDLSKRITAKRAFARTRNTRRKDVMAVVVSKSTSVMATAMMSTTIADAVMMAVIAAPRMAR